MRVYVSSRIKYNKFNNYNVIRGQPINLMQFNYIGHVKVPNALWQTTRHLLGLTLSLKLYNTDI